MPNPWPKPPQRAAGERAGGLRVIGGLRGDGLVGGLTDHGEHAGAAG